MEWLFLTCHNSWIVCRLVRGNGDPFLAYSPTCSIENSRPFRAFLGAILSVHEDVAVQASVYNPDMGLDLVPEEKEDGPLPEDDIDDGSGRSRQPVPAQPPVVMLRNPG